MKDYHGKANTTTAPLEELSVKRLAWAYGTSKKGTDEEAVLLVRLSAKMESVRPNGRLVDRIAMWVRTRLGEQLLTNRWERAMRVLEEAMELAQAEGVDPSKVEALMDRVYSRPKGEPSQEAAGLQVCLLAYSCAAGLDLDKVTADEVARVERMDVRKLHEKHNAKAELGLALPVK